MNILEMLKSSDKAALIQGEKCVTYYELLNSGMQFGKKLKDCGIKSGSHVLVFVPLSIELYIAMIGAWTIGAIPIFIDFSQGAKFVNNSIERLTPDIIICDKVTSLVRLTYAKMRKLRKLKIIIDFTDSIRQSAKLQCDHPAIMTLTSGTTGIPKIAVRTHGFLIAQYHALTAHMDYNENHVDLGTLPVFTLASLASHMTILLPNKSYKSKINFADLALQMQEECVSRAICSPAIMSKLLNHSDFPDLRSVYLGGAPVYPSVLKKIPKRVDLNIVYGSTEAEPIAGIAWADVSENDRQNISNGAGLLVGHIVPEVECRIGNNSEIQVSGETVLKGYLGGIGDEENKILEGDKTWHKTGDAGYIDEQGRLWLLGRVSQAIHDESGTLYPFCAECILDSHFGIRGAFLLQNKERVAVIEKGFVNENDVLQALKSQHISKIITIKKIPMDKRHGAKIDYERLLKSLLR